MSGWEGRAPSELQIGNGTLLATFDSTGEIEQIFAPHIDALQAKFGACRTSVIFPDAGRGVPHVVDVGSEAFEVKIRLLRGTQSFEAEYTYKHGPLRLLRSLGVHPKEPVIMDSWKVLNGPVGLLHQSIPWIGHSTSAHCSLYHPSFNGLVHHRGRRWIGVLVRGEIQWVQVGHLSDYDRSLLWDGVPVRAPVRPEDIAGYPAGPVRLGWDQVAQGPAVWGAFATGPVESVEFLLICGESERHLGELLRQGQNVETNRYFQMIDSVVSRRHGPAEDLLGQITNPKVRALAERSIDVLHALQDSGTGALMAAAEVDPHSRMSGGYGYSWPRDGAYLAIALGAWGFAERVERYFEFLAQTQDPSGAWWQRYLATGHAGPSWGRIQIDETAAVVRAAAVHFENTQDLFWLEKFWPTLERGLGFLEAFHGREHPLGLPSHDLWEERMGIHAYSLGSVASAFEAAAFLAGELSYGPLKEHYSEWGKTLKGILVEKFCSDPGPVRRSYLNGYWDETPDSSLLGLITPFEVFKPFDPAAQKILDSIRGRLWSHPVGGILRYPGDHYRGGNPWILTTMWLGMIELQVGNFGDAKKCFDWTMSKTTDLGFLAEQVHRETGEPHWVIPLGWSHAMFLLFVREVLDRDAQTLIWGEGTG